MDRNSVLGSVFILLCLGLPVIGKEPIEPIPTNLIIDSEKAALGKKLFNDVRLSKDDSVSCASCHEMGMYGTDNRKVSKGINDQLGKRNSPTVFNAVFNFKQFWDGRADDLHEQAALPVMDPREMAMDSWEDVVSKISKDPEYQHDFNLVFDGELNADTITGAIAEYEKTLVTVNAPFDQYLRGDDAAISDEQKRGYHLFKAFGCSSCHQGVNVGGNMFQKFGVLKDINLKEGGASSDLGRFDVTGNQWDKHVFKVPSLRLAVKTAPYFHDGSIATIEEAVDIMIEYQLGREVDKDDKSAIIAFLGSLVGENGEIVK